jgi:hypothetical protein
MTCGCRARRKALTEQSRKAAARKTAKKKTAGDAEEEVEEVEEVELTAEGLVAEVAGHGGRVVRASGPLSVGTTASTTPAGKKGKKEGKKGGAEEEEEWDVSEAVPVPCLGGGGGELTQGPGVHHRAALFNGAGTSQRDIEGTLN